MEEAKSHFLKQIESQLDLFTSKFSSNKEIEIMKEKISSLENEVKLLRSEIQTLKYQNDFSPSKRQRTSSDSKRISINIPTQSFEENYFTTLRNRTLCFA